MREEKATIITDEIYKRLRADTYLKSILDKPAKHFSATSEAAYESPKQSRTLGQAEQRHSSPHRQRSAAAEQTYSSPHRQRSTAAEQTYSSPHRQRSTAAEQTYSSPHRQRSAAAEQRYSSPSRSSSSTTNIRGELEELFQGWVAKNQTECGLYLSDEPESRLQMILECSRAQLRISHPSKLKIIGTDESRLYITSDNNFVVNGTPLRNSTYIYVWTKDGISVAPSSLGSSVNMQMIRHTSLAFGQPVLCAGEITFYDGVITEVNNCSGHYRPSVQHLANFSNYLEKFENITFTYAESYQRGDGKTILDRTITAEVIEDLKDIPVCQHTTQPETSHSTAFLTFKDSGQPQEDLGQFTGSFLRKKQRIEQDPKSLQRS
ncbi:MAG: hypothetical protein HOH73_01330 [Alphaproteobacteria bacterium]|jgi:hypothetical protein|nr:hypothetical protein [Alphaproteobacteria bacterium]